MFCYKVYSYVIEIYIATQLENKKKFGCYAVHSVCMIKIKTLDAFSGIVPAKLQPKTISTDPKQLH